MRATLKKNQGRPSDAEKKSGGRETWGPHKDDGPNPNLS